ncbi:hypothetical protein EHS25_009676 [Saitozyma podzolica]|uniref:Mini-chromosome maintenance complex-binding protein n=1 Tax=Saitozyma podzolica TaxID=1890683 RepID=A0A427YJX7_9TREE|nr:hypothetical protein EHS25_009676 [Saitozyma podzolica]
MLDTASIIRTALREHDVEAELPDDVDAFIKQTQEILKQPSTIPAYSRSSPALSLVSFRCMLQDTGYPMEVYVSGQEQTEPEDELDWSQLQERWVGWAVEIPGQQDWTRGDTLGINGLSVNDAPRHSAALGKKFPLPEKRDSYLGALVKVYDDVSYRPASTHNLLGIVSSASLPSPATHDDQEEDGVSVAAIHVLGIASVSPTESTAIRTSIREELIDHLASAFDPPDKIAAEYLLLNLISSPTVRPAALSPLGTLSLNFIQSSPASTSAIASAIGQLVPAMVPVALSLDRLHSTTFSPVSSDSASLDAGLLQLSDGTVLVIDETGMGEGGKLEDRAVKNLRALSETMSEQKLRYEYPYMEGLKMDCALRAIVVSDGKSLLPADVHFPLLPSAAPSSRPSTTQPQLNAFRSYLAACSTPDHAAKIVIPEDVAELIQEDFVRSRQHPTGNTTVGDAELGLKRKMRVARVMALSYPDARLTKVVWEQTASLDEEAQARLKQRAAVRRNVKLGQPNGQDQ